MEALEGLTTGFKQAKRPLTGPFSYYLTRWNLTATVQAPTEVAGWPGPAWLWQPAG